VLVLLVAGTAAATGGHSPLMVVPIVVAVLVPAGPASQPAGPAVHGPSSST